MSDDLVKRLRFGSLTTMGSHRMNLEAADRIEDLEAENRRLRDAVDKMNCTTPIANILQDEDIPSQLFGRLAGVLKDQHDALAELKGGE